MTDLTKIFPQNYPDLPTWKDIQVIFNDLLNRSDSVDDIVLRIDKEACPYYKHALTLYLAQQLTTWYDQHHEIAGYQQGNSWIPYWHKPKDKIRYLVNKYQAQQAVIQQEPLFLTTTSTTSRSTKHSRVERIQKSIKQAVKDIIADITPAQPIVIQNLTINYYNAPIGQYDNTTITGLDKLIQDNHGTMNF